MYVKGLLFVALEHCNVRPRTAPKHQCVETHLLLPSFQDHSHAGVFNTFYLRVFSVISSLKVFGEAVLRGEDVETVSAQRRMLVNNSSVLMHTGRRTHARIHRHRDRHTHKHTHAHISHAQTSLVKMGHLGFVLSLCRFGIRSSQLETKQRTCLSAFTSGGEVTWPALNYQ